MDRVLENRRFAFGRSERVQAGSEDFRLVFAATDLGAGEYTVKILFHIAAAQRGQNMVVLACRCNGHLYAAALKQIEKFTHTGLGLHKVIVKMPDHFVYAFLDLSGRHFKVILALKI